MLSEQNPLMMDTVKAYRRYLESREALQKSQTRCEESRAAYEVAREKMLKTETTDLEIQRDDYAERIVTALSKIINMMENQRSAIMSTILLEKATDTIPLLQCATNATLRHLPRDFQEDTALDALAAARTSLTATDSFQHQRKLVYALYPDHWEEIGYRPNALIESNEPACLILSISECSTLKEGAPVDFILSLVTRNQEGIPISALNDVYLTLAGTVKIKVPPEIPMPIEVVPNQFEKARTAMMEHLEDHYHHLFEITGPALEPLDTFWEKFYDHAKKANIVVPPGIEDIIGPMLAASIIGGVGKHTRLAVMDVKSGSVFIPDRALSFEDAPYIITSQMLDGGDYFVRVWALNESPATPKSPYIGYMATTGEENLRYGTENEKVTFWKHVNEAIKDYPGLIGNLNQIRQTTEYAIAHKAERCKHREEVELVIVFGAYFSSNQLEIMWDPPALEGGLTAAVQISISGYRASYLVLKTI